MKMGLGISADILIKSEGLLHLYILYRCKADLINGRLQSAANPRTIYL